jgi:hypothetical protein
MIRYFIVQTAVWFAFFMGGSHREPAPFVLWGGADDFNSRDMEEGEPKRRDTRKKYICGVLMAEQKTDTEPLYYTEEEVL